VFENLNALQAMAFVMEQWDGQRGHKWSNGMGRGGMAPRHLVDPKLASSFIC